jgi:hypothetical protein
MVCNESISLIPKCLHELIFPFAFVCFELVFMLTDEFCVE